MRLLLPSFGLALLISLCQSQSIIASDAVDTQPSITTATLHIKTLEESDIDDYLRIRNDSELYTRSVASGTSIERKKALSCIQASGDRKDTPCKLYGVWPKDEVREPGTMLGISDFHTDPYPPIEGDFRCGWMLKSDKLERHEELLKAMMQLGFEHFPQVNSLSFGIAANDRNTLNLLNGLDPNLRPNATYAGGGHNPNGDYFHLRSFYHQEDRNITWLTYVISRQNYDIWKATQSDGNNL